jgi:hypothetical protein
MHGMIEVDIHVPANNEFLVTAGNCGIARSVWKNPLDISKE